MKDIGLFLTTLQLDMNQADTNVDCFDGLLSGGNVKNYIQRQYPNVLKCVQLAHKGPLVNYGGQVALKLTEKTFISIVSLIGLTSELQQAEAILDDLPDLEMVDSFTHDIELHKVFN